MSLVGLLVSTLLHHSGVFLIPSMMHVTKRINRERYEISVFTDDVLAWFAFI